ncbi:MAG: suppressor of fused domain protein [Flavobacteriaceae bacterium]|jgi:hypothetical protein|nr:suppressor of fused domain protein [Flavobacteriaceae bacterium]
MIPTEEDKQYAKLLAHSLGIEEKPEIYTYYDEDESHSVDIISIVDPIDKNVVISSSIGLSNYSNLIEMKDGTEFSIPVELLMVSYKEFDSMQNVISTVSFYIMKNSWNCQPGTVFKSMISDYYDFPMKHVMFIRPYLWEDKLSNLKFGKKSVHCLLLVPISDEELQYKLEYGSSSLEELLFGVHKIDLYDLKRKSVV